MTVSASSAPLPLERVARAKRTRAPYALRLLSIQSAFGAALILEVLQGRWTDGPWLRAGLLSVGLLLLVPALIGSLEAMPWVTVFLVILVLIAKRALGDPGGALILLLPLGIAAICAAILTAAEERRGLRWAAWLGASRDGLWRLAALLAVGISSLAIANRIERDVFESAFRTPLEGIALSAGILAGALSVVVLTWAAWRLPRLVAERQCKGFILPDAGRDTLWFGLLLCATAIALDLRGILTSGTFSDVLGANCWLALAATAAFALVRLRLPPAFRTDADTPLWIVFLGGSDSSAKARGHAARLSTLWREGPVTVVSEPDVALRSGGAHLRLARMRNRLDALFPQRLIHLADWVETLPPAENWQTLPIRELYARPALWPDLLAARLETNARIVVIDDSLPDDAVLDRLRVMLPAGRTEFHLPEAAETDRLRGRWSSVVVFSFDGPTSVKRWVGLGRPSTRVERRYLLIDYMEADEVFAQRLKTSLDGARDARNKFIRAYAAPRTSNISDVVASRLLRLGERKSAIFPILRLLLTSAAGVSLLVRAMTRMFALFQLRRGDEYDLVLLEPQATNVNYRELLDASPRRTDLRLIDRLIGILREGGGEYPELPFEPASYTGTIRIPSADLEQQVATVARRILMLDLDEVTLPSIGTFPPIVLKTRPGVCFSYVETYGELAHSLARMLEAICDVTDLTIDRQGGRSSKEEIELINRADAVVAIVGPDTVRSEWARFELEWAQQSRKPLLLVFVKPFHDAPALSKLVGANRTPEGVYMYLADYADLPGRLDRVLRLTAENIAKELARLVPMASLAHDFNHPKGEIRAER